MTPALVRHTLLAGLIEARLCCSLVAARSPPRTAPTRAFCSPQMQSSARDSAQPRDSEPSPSPLQRAGRGRGRRYERHRRV